ncbi:MAG: hypothetical protein K2L10_00890 [Ruminococcus sp.]|nr:hypothetical protein [Ruminococcus sp.]
MIILQIILYILLAVLGIALAVLLLALWLPATADVSFIDGKFSYRFNFAFLRLLDSDGKGFLKRRKKNENSEDEDFSDNDFLADDYYDEDFPEYDDDMDDIDIDIPEDDNDDFNIDVDIPDEQKENDMRSEKIRRIREKKSDKSEEDFQEDTEDFSEKSRSLSDKIESLLNIWDIGGQPLLRAFRGFHIKNIYIDFIVADEDAYKCAMNYGNVCSVVYNCLAWLGEIFTLSYKTVDIQCGFSLKKSQWDASCKVSFRLYNLVISGVWFLTTYIFKIFIPKKLKRKRKK